MRMPTERAGRDPEQSGFAPARFLSMSLVRLLFDKGTGRVTRCRHFSASVTRCESFPERITSCTAHP